MKSFGDLLREYRRRLSMTQQEIADRLGLSSPYIAQMESGFKPPPPEAIVDKLAKIMRLPAEDHRVFSQSAEAERELQSLLKATRKAGYILSGNKVCVPQDAVNYCAKVELDKLIEAIPKNSTFHLDLNREQIKAWDAGSNGASLTSPADLHSWALAALGEQPAVWLCFLGELFEVLILTPDSRLLCRNPSKKRSGIVKYGKDAGIFFQNLSHVLQEACGRAADQHLPNVVAPDSNWEKISDVLDRRDEPVERVTKGGASGIRDIPVTHTIPVGSDILQEQPGLGSIGLPSEWFLNSKDYEACLVQTEAYISMGVYPNSKVVYEIDGEPRENDLVVALIHEFLYFRRYYTLGNTVMLQGGGGMARPEPLKPGDSSIQIIGVVRELVARFRDIHPST